MNATPIRTVADGNGRDRCGRFATGNKLARGNPMNRRVQRLRVALLQAVGTDDVRQVVKALLAKAMKGDVAAATLLFDRLLGRPTPAEAPQPVQVVQAEQILMAISREDSDAMQRLVGLPDATGG